MGSRPAPNKEQIARENAALRKKLLAMRELAKRKDEEIKRLAALYLNRQLQPLDTRKRRGPERPIPVDLPPNKTKRGGSLVSRRGEAKSALDNPAFDGGASGDADEDEEEFGDIDNDKEDEELRRNMSSAQAELATAAGMTTTKTTTTQDGWTTRESSTVAVVEPHEVDGDFDDDGMPLAANQKVFPPFDPDAGTTHAVLYKLPTDASWGIEFVFGVDQTPIVAKWGEDTPGSRSVQIKQGMMVYSINGESTIGCGAQKLVTIMKKKGLLGQSKKTVSATFEVTNSLIPEVAGGNIAAEIDTLRAQKVAWWSRTGPRNKKKGESGEPQTPSVAAAPTSAAEQTPDAGPQFVLTRPLRPVSMRRGSGGPVPDDARARLQALRVDAESMQPTPVNADGKRKRNRMSIRQTTVEKQGLMPMSNRLATAPEEEEVFGFGRSGSDGGETKNPLFGQDMAQMSAGSSDADTDDSEDDGNGGNNWAMADPGQPRARPTLAPPPVHRATLPASDYFLSMINSGVEEGDELSDADGCRYHFSNGRPVYREEDVAALAKGAKRPGTPTGVQSFDAKSPDRRHVVDDDVDTNFGFDSGDVDDLDDE